MLRDTAEREIAGVRPSLAAPPAAGRLERISTCTSRRRARPSWVLWIDVWGEALRDANLRRISEELDAAWVELIAEVITAGVASGSFRCADPVASAWRLCALLDGLGLQVVLHHGTMTRPRCTSSRHAARSSSPTTSRLTLRIWSPLRERSAARGPSGLRYPLPVQSSRLLAVDRWSTRLGG